MSRGSALTVRHARWLVLLSIAACTAPVDGVSVAASPLIGGGGAKPGEFPSTVVLARPVVPSDGSSALHAFCTAAKVGPRHFLLAGHCVVQVDSASGQVGLRPHVAPEQVLYLTNRPSLEVRPDAMTAVRVEATSVHPEFLASCARDPSKCGAMGGDNDRAPDVALILVDRATPAIPAARIDLRPVRVGEPLSIQGFGCRDSVRTSEQRREIELRWARTFALPPDAPAFRDAYRRYLPTQYRDEIGAVYLMTPGPVVDSDQGGLCPGDSGGPLYRRQGNDDLVVGVNASYSFRANSAGTDIIPFPLTNWHTRLDQEARHSVAAWLIERGAQVTRTAEPEVALEHTDCAAGDERRDLPSGGFYCVDPATGLADSRMRTLDMQLACLSEKQAQGLPTAPCGSDRWEESLLLRARGAERCPAGAHLDVRLGVCVQTFWGLGRMPAYLREACTDAQLNCEGVTPYLASMHRAVAGGAVYPVLDCVRRNASGTRTARFGYFSEALRPVHIRVGGHNYFSGGIDRGQVADFLPGRGRETFEVTYRADESLVWTLTTPDGVSRTATAGALVPRCR